MRKRTAGRELALKFLFGRDLMGEYALEGFTELATDQESVHEAREFAQELVEGVLAERERLQETIEKATRNWTWRRMPAVDRNLLLLGAYELLFRDDIPATVTINEVVELAKRFSTSSSGAFVNGVLDTIKREKE